MNRAFKIEFHNGFPDMKPIVTMSVKVNNGKRFKTLDQDGRDALIAQLKSFIKSVQEFENEIEKGYYQTT